MLVFYPHLMAQVSINLCDFPSGRVLEIPLVLIFGL